MKEVDPIEELHCIRQIMYKKAGATPEAFVRYLMEQQKHYADRLVNLSKATSAQATVRKPLKKPVTKSSSRKTGKRRMVIA